MNKVSYIKTFIMVFLFLKQGVCQNLVQNSSFEELTECPVRINQLKFCKYWINPDHAGTPDYFSTCDSLSTESIVKTPGNFMGNQTPHSGLSYVGILNYFSQYYSCQEYIQSQLTQPLIAGKRYRVSAFISLADNSNYFNDQLQFCFGEKDLKSKFIKGYKLLYCEDGVTINGGDAFKDTSNWNLISTVYEAIGGEQFLTIGVFKQMINKSEHRKKIAKNVLDVKTETDVAYYYIDDVSVEEIK